jgi:hypothetical protein
VTQIPLAELSLRGREPAKLAVRGGRPTAGEPWIEPPVSAFAFMVLDYGGPPDEFLDLARTGIIELTISEQKRTGILI